MSENRSRPGRVERAIPMKKLWQQMEGEQRGAFLRIVIAAVLYVVAIVLEHTTGLGRWWMLAIFAVPYLLVGYETLGEAAEKIIHRELLDEDFLMAVASLGAFAVGEYPEAVAVMLLFQIGELFEDVAVDRSRRNIAELMDIRPDYANVEENGNLTQVAPDTLPVGSVIVVRPGEKVPLDGVVLEGTSTLDTSALTGESLPRDISVGDEVISGCVNQNGLLKVRTTKTFGDSTAAKILDLVENASSRKSKSEHFITKFAKYYTPIVVGAAVLLAVLPPILRMTALGTDPNWTDWIHRALAFLVISCPCAIVISVPLSFFGGIGGASGQGILIKGSNYLETLSEVREVVFDKTGTITKGNFEVTGVHHCSMESERLFELAAHAESASTHPIAESIRRAHGGPIDQSRVTELMERSGEGIVCRVDNIPVAVGNYKLMDSLGIPAQECTSIGTIVHVAVDGTYAGHMVISDELKPHTKEALVELKALGIRKTIMLTGDNEAVASSVAEEIGLDETYASLLPADKVRHVETLLEEINSAGGKDRLAFVGDGINDAPVLSRADIGIAMGGLGSDAAIEAADVVLMDDDPLKIPKAIRIAKKCLTIVKTNIAFALTVKAICLVLGALGIGGMWLAIFADVGVLILCILNAMRCLMVQKV